MRTIIKCISIAICTLLVSPMPAVAGQETIRIATGEYPPFLSQHLKHKGVGLRIIEEAFAREGIRVTYAFFPWKRSYQLAKDGKWDASATWAHKEERDTDFYFSDPLYRSTGVFFHLKNHPFDWRTVEDLQSISIGAIKGYTYTPEFWQAVEDGTLNVTLVNSDEQLVKMLLNERIQVFPKNIDVGYFLLNNTFTRKVRERVIHHPRPFTDNFTYLIFSRKVQKNKRMVDLFNKGLTDLKQDGTIERYFKESRRGEYSRKD